MFLTAIACTHTYLTLFVFGLTMSLPHFRCSQVDCGGSWSACTSSCEEGGNRTWEHRVTPNKFGKPCPASAPNCVAGAGACKVRIMMPPSPLVWTLLDVCAYKLCTQMVCPSACVTSYVQI